MFPPAGRNKKHYFCPDWCVASSPVLSHYPTLKTDKSPKYWSQASVCLFLNLIGLESLLTIFSVWINRLSNWLYLLASPQAHLVPAPWHEISRPTQEGTEGWSRALHHTLILRPGENRKKCSAQHLGVAGAARPWAQTEWVNTNDWANGRWGAHAFARPVKKKKKCMSYNKVFLFCQVILHHRGFLCQVTGFCFGQSKLPGQYTGGTTGQEFTGAL